MQINRMSGQAENFDKRMVDRIEDNDVPPVATKIIWNEDVLKVQEKVRKRISTNHSGQSSRWLRRYFSGR